MQDHAEAALAAALDFAELELAPICELLARVQ